MGFRTALTEEKLSEFSIDSSEGLTLYAHWVDHTGGGDTPDDPDDPDDPTTHKGLWIRWVDGTTKYPYTGSAVKPEIEVYHDEDLLYEKADYTLSYKNNKNVGSDARIYITGKGNYSGKYYARFTIEKTDLSEASADPVILGYDKKKHNNSKPALYLNGVKLKLAKGDVSYRYVKGDSDSECKEAGDYTIRITAQSGSTHYQAGTYMEVPLSVVDLKNADKDGVYSVRISSVKLKAGGSLGYTGEAVNPNYILTYKGATLTKGTNYTEGFDGTDSYIKPGSHTMTLSGGNGVLEVGGKKIRFIGTRRVTFKISGKYDLSSTERAKVTVSDAEYTNGGAKGAVKVTYNGAALKAGRDYSVTYSGHKAVGTATVKIKGKGAYTGLQTATYQVKQRDLASLVLTVYDRKESKKAGDYKKTQIVFGDEAYRNQKLKAGRDYEITSFSVSSNTETPKAGATVTIAIKGLGNYSGTQTATYRIIDGKKDIGKAKVKINGGKAYSYLAGAVVPTSGQISVILNKQTVGESETNGYEILGCYNNVDKGTAVLVLRGTDSYNGIKIVKYRIGSRKVTDWF